MNAPAPDACRKVPKTNSKKMIVTLNSTTSPNAPTVSFEVTLSKSNAGAVKGAGK